MEKQVNKTHSDRKKAESIHSKYVRQKRSEQIWRQFRKNKGAVAGLIVFGIIVLVAIVSSFVLDYETQVIQMVPAERLKTPSMTHLFGTDQMGRDVLMRICYGAKYSLIIGVCSVMVSMLVGTTLGCIAGYFGGKVEAVIMRIMEVFLMIPNLLIVIMFVAILGTSFVNLIIAIGASTIPHFSRTARAAVMTVRDNEYVEAARAIGCKDMSIIFKHVFPNAFSSILVQASMRMGGNIILASSFSFLGIGVPAPMPEWGTMLSDARSYMREYPYLTFWPGAFIFITVLAINLAGDGLRDALDPKLKR